jgi:hypothetical protein
MISAVGVSVLTGMTYAPSGRSGLVAAVVPPWQEGGLARAAATGLPFLGLRWRGHLMILDTGADAAVLARLRAEGLWLLDASGFLMCGLGRERGEDDLDS